MPVVIVPTAEVCVLEARRGQLIPHAPLCCSLEASVAGCPLQSCLPLPAPGQAHLSPLILCLFQEVFLGFLTGNKQPSSSPAPMSTTCSLLCPNSAVTGTVQVHGTTTVDYPKETGSRTASYSVSFPTVHLHPGPWHQDF
jgi:hypothetical protein